MAQKSTGFPGNLQAEGMKVLEYLTFSRQYFIVQAVGFRNDESGERK